MAFYLKRTESSRFNIRESVHGDAEVTFILFCYSIEFHSSLTL
jgi:hypothetical protein